MADKRVVYLWDKTPDWAERDMTAVVEALGAAFAENEEVSRRLPLPDGRELGEVAWRACLAVRAGQVPGLPDLLADVANSLGTLFENGFEEFARTDWTERHGALSEAVQPPPPSRDFG